MSRRTGARPRRTTATTPLLARYTLHTTWTNVAEHAAPPSKSWGSRGRGFESRRPDAAQRAYPIDGCALSSSLSDQLGDYRSQIVRRIWFIAVSAHVGGVLASDVPSSRRGPRRRQGGPERAARTAPGAHPRLADVHAGTPTPATGAQCGAGTADERQACRDTAPPGRALPTEGPDDPPAAGGTGYGWARCPSGHRPGQAERTAARRASRRSNVKVRLTWPAALRSAPTAVRVDGCIELASTRCRAARRRRPRPAPLMRMPPPQMQPGARPGTHGSSTTA
jgi:hypothetical protein